MVEKTVFSQSPIGSLGTSFITVLGMLSDAINMVWMYLDCGPQTQVSLVFLDFLKSVLSDAFSPEKSHEFSLKIM